MCLYLATPIGKILWLQTAVMDNFDHQDKSSLSDPKDNHDTAIVLFQNGKRNSIDSKKGKVSELGIAIKGRKYIEELEC